jgi:hypothetical protein
MNAEQIAKALRSCARNCDGSHSCWHSAILKDAAALIESLQAQLAASRRRERAAVEDIKELLYRSTDCMFCAYEYGPCGAADCRVRANWRGPSGAGKGEQNG